MIGISTSDSVHTCQNICEVEIHHRQLIVCLIFYKVFKKDYRGIVARHKHTALCLVDSGQRVSVPTLGNV